MKKSTCLIVWVVTAATLISGCHNPSPDIEASQISKVEISCPSGGFVSTDRADIARLVGAMCKAEPDSMLYDTPKTTRIKFFAGPNVVHTVPAGGPLFDFEGQQYHERSGEFRKLLSELLNQGRKKQNNTSEHIP